MLVAAFLCSGSFHCRDGDRRRWTVTPPILRTSSITLPESIESGCGLDIADAAMDISRGNDPLNFDPCDPAFTPGVITYFQNGFDHEPGPGCALDDSGNLYLGMRVVEGIIGDPDGNGDADDNVCEGTLSTSPTLGRDQRLSEHLPAGRSGHRL